MANDNVNTEEIKLELKKISDQVKEHGEKALSEASKARDLSAKSKEQIDELLVKQGELMARLADVEQKAARRAGGDDSAQFKSLGEQLTDDKEFKQYLERRSGERKSSFSMAVKAITSTPTSGGAGVAPDRQSDIMALPQRRLTVRDLISPGRTGSNLVQYIQETGFVNNAAATPEGVRKPESSIQFELKQAPVIKIPHFIKASTEILSDFPQLQSFVDVKLRYGLGMAEEKQLLNGSGGGNNLKGINTSATNYLAPIAIAGANRIDVLRLALLQAELAEYPSTGIVINPIDWAAIELLKDSTGAYIFSNPQAVSTPALWGRNVVATQAMVVDNFLCGAFQLGAQVFDRQQAQITIATENEDDFVNNLVTILAEERLALAVYRPEAFVKGDITPA